MKKRKPLARSTVPIPKKRLKPRRKPFPDAKDKREPVAVRVLADGREIVNMFTAAGREIYRSRKRIAWLAQGELCAICGRYVSWEECEADHIRPRSVGHDDRQENIQATHPYCNFRKGSQQNYSLKGKGHRCAATAKLTERPSAATAATLESSMRLGVDASMRDAAAKKMEPIQRKRVRSERE